MTMSTGFEFRHLSKIKQDNITKEWPLASQKEKRNCEQYIERGAGIKMGQTGVCGEYKCPIINSSYIYYCWVHIVHNQGTVYYVQNTRYSCKVHFSGISTGILYVKCAQRWVYFYPGTGSHGHFVQLFILSNIHFAHAGYEAALGSASIG